MMPDYKWSDDKRTTGELDPFSAWLLHHGADFELSREEAKDDGDFTYRIAVKDFDSNRIPDDLVRIVRPNGGFQERHTYPAPLRKRSVGDDPELNRLSDSSWSKPEAEGIDSSKLVIVAVIDDSINLVHERFQTIRNGAIGSRIDFAWIQDGDFERGSSTVPFGREWTRDDLEDVLQQAHGDEGESLRYLGLLDFTRPGRAPLAFRASHGTHVLDLAAGADPDDVEHISTRIIAVQLPLLVTHDTSGAQLDAFFTAALEYVLRRVRNISKELGDDETAKKVPVVVNFSYGVSGGPKGTDRLGERAIEALIDYHQRQKGGQVEIVLPAGNANLERGHALAEAKTGGKTELSLPWRVQPDDRTSNHLEIILPADADGLELHVAPPPGNDEDLAQVLPPKGQLQSANPSSEAAEVKPRILWRDEDKRTVIARVSLDRLPTNGEAKVQRILVSLAPTRLLASDRDVAPCGLWKVNVKANLSKGGRIEAWILRDDVPLGFPRRGRQSYFDDENYRRFDEFGDHLSVDPAKSACLVRRAGTLNGLATNTHALAVGGYVGGVGRMASPNRRVAHYSSSGSSTIRYPDVAALSDTTLILGGVLAAGTRSGYRVAVNGTSVAAPQVARLLAEAIRPGGNPPGRVIARGAAVRTTEPPDRAGAGFIPPTLGSDLGGVLHRRAPTWF